MSQQKHVYVVLDPTYQAAPGLERIDYSPKVEHGDVFIQEQRLHPREPGIAEDGPLRVTFTPGYLGTWGLNDDNEPALPPSTRRILELLSIGSEQEQRLRKELHAAFELVREAVDELVTDAEQKQKLLSRMAAIEKRLQ